MRFRYHTLLYKLLEEISNSCGITFKSVCECGEGIAAFAIDEFDRM
jgi:hypothetical protein